MKSIDAQSCRALKSRGSRTSRRIVIRTSTNGLPNQEAIPRILFCAQRNTPIFICDSPALLQRVPEPLDPACACGLLVAFRTTQLHYGRSSQHPPLRVQLSRTSGIPPDADLRFGYETYGSIH